jgi:hypothetical protein
VGDYTSAILSTRFDMPFLVGLIAAGVVRAWWGSLRAAVIRQGLLTSPSPTIAAKVFILWVVNQCAGRRPDRHDGALPPSAGSLPQRPEPVPLIIGDNRPLRVRGKNMARTRVAAPSSPSAINDLAAEVHGNQSTNFMLLAFFIAVLRGHRRQPRRHWNVSLTRSSSASRTPSCTWA